MASIPSDDTSSNPGIAFAAVRLAFLLSCLGTSLFGVQAYTVRVSVHCACLCMGLCDNTSV
jgi:hypothetical protein